MFCIVCGDFSGEQEICRDCQKIYDEDIRAGKYPSGLSEEGRSRFTYTWWEHIKRLEHRVKCGAILPDEAKKTFELYIKQLNGVFAETPEQRAARQERESFKLY